MYFYCLESLDYLIEMVSDCRILGILFIYFGEWCICFNIIFWGMVGFVLMINWVVISIVWFNIVMFM